MTSSNQREPTHVCLGCGTKQAEPDNPLGWCLSCFGAQAIPLSEISTRVFLDDIIPTGHSMLVLHCGFDGVFLTNRAGAGNVLTLTIEDIDLMAQKLKESINGNRVLHRENQANEIKHLSEIHHNNPAGWRNIAFTEPGYIYLGYNQERDVYKIGLSKNPKNRVKKLRCKLIHQIKSDNMGRGEQKLLQGLSHKRAIDLTKTHGYEWFYLDKNDVNYIKSIIGYNDGRFIFEGENNG